MHRGALEGGEKERERERCDKTQTPVLQMLFGYGQRPLAPSLSLFPLCVSHLTLSRSFPPPPPPPLGPVPHYPHAIRTSRLSYALVPPHADDLAAVHTLSRTELA
jgi:hypothetical protein